MANLLITLLTVVTALTTALVGGVFFIFSVTIMRSLGRISAPAGIAAMQEINIVIVQSLFLTAFFGAALTSLILGGYALANWQSPASLWLIAGSLAYLVGCIGPTMVCNVPLNNELAAVAPASTEAQVVWTRYLADWTMWNHIRTIACVAAALCFIMALLNRA